MARLSLYLEYNTEEEIMKEILFDLGIFFIAVGIVKGAISLYMIKRGK